MTPRNNAATPQTGRARCRRRTRHASGIAGIIQRAPIASLRSPTAPPETPDLPDLPDLVDLLEVPACDLPGLSESNLADLLDLPVTD